MGSGKTWAGVFKIVQQPKSNGMVLAPTYPMLRDATLRTFLELTESWRVLRAFKKSEMKAILVNGTEVLFRSTEYPDRLRGPNLGWFMMDEAAISKRQAFLIMLGRLREEPGIAWVTTTPRGKNWVYETFVYGGGDYRIIRAPSDSNRFLPSSFVAGLRHAYKGIFARQEVDGEFVDDQTDALVPGDWLDRCERASHDALARHSWPRLGHARLAIDLGAGNGGDNTVLIVRDDAAIHDLCHSSRWTFPQAASRAALLAQKHHVQPHRISWDSVGIGKGFGEGFLKPLGITGQPYGGGDSGGGRFFNLRSAAAWLVRQRLDPDADPQGTGKVQSPFLIRPEDLALLRKELSGLKWTINNERKIALQPKEEYMAELGHSPDFADTMIQSFAYLN